MTAPPLSTVVFDLGGVVLSWDPRLPYEQVMPAADVPQFLSRIDFENWNRAHDAGQPFEVGERTLVERFPEAAGAVRAYRQHYALSLTGMVPGTSAVIAEVQQAGLRLLALTNWSAETFPHAQQRFGLLRRFESILVSGQERLAKPDPAIFELLARRHRLDPAECVFIDDSSANVAAAAELGMTALRFVDAVTLRADLQRLGLLGERAVVTESVFHLTEVERWQSARETGGYMWSSRDVSYEQQGYVHCAFAAQVPGVRSRIYADLADDDLVLLELDPSTLEVVVEDLGAGEAFPHLCQPLPVTSVRAARPL